MNDEELSSILSREDEIVPSSGFVESVMDSIHRDALEPAPIPFPWKRALPGVVLSATLIAIFLGRFVKSGHVAGMEQSAPGRGLDIVILRSLSEIERAMIHAGAGWLLLALVLSFVTWNLSMMLAMRRG